MRNPALWIAGTLLAGAIIFANIWFFAVGLLFFLGADFHIK